MAAFLGSTTGFVKAPRAAVESRKPLNVQANPNAAGPKKVCALLAQAGGASPAGRLSRPPAAPPPPRVWRRRPAFLPPDAALRCAAAPS